MESGPEICKAKGAWQKSHAVYFLIELGGVILTGLVLYWQKN